MSRVLLGFLLLWLVLDRAAAALGSTRGEWGFLIFVLVLGAALLVERVLHGRDVRNALNDLGFKRSSGPALGFALALSGALLAFFPLYAAATGVAVALAAGWPLLALGIFAQGGLAEETIFRGYLFRHFRKGRSFRSAALLSAIPFTLVHLLLFATIAFPLALASLLVALALSFPFAWLFERGGNAIWAPALLHAVVQGAIKLVIFPEAALPGAALSWMALSTLLPFLAFLLPAGSERK